jgi:hypothetical protein
MRSAADLAAWLLPHAIGQPALDLAACPIADLDTEPLERAGRWNDDPTPPALLHYQPGKMRKPVKRAADR